MEKWNTYYKVGAIGLAINLVLALVLPFLIDPYLASISGAFIPVWIMVLVVGWRKEHPRR